MYLAIDVGGTKTLLAVFDEAGKVVEEQKFPTSPEYPVFIADLAKNIVELTTKGFKVAVMALPGTLQRETGVAESFGNLSWVNVPIRDDVQKTLTCPIIIENDAKAAGLAEAMSLKEFKRVLYITISTGIGLGLTVDGKIDYSLHDAGGFGMLMEHEGKLQPWEAYASGKAIVAKYGKRASEIDDPAVWEEIAKTWIAGFMELIDLTSPDVIVIGGGVGSHFNKFGDILARQLKSNEGKMLTIPPLREAQHPEEAVVYGCYQLAKDYSPPANLTPEAENGLSSR